MADFGFLRAVGDYFSLVGAKTVNRMGGALTDAEADKYTFERATGDVLGFYNDVLGAWFGLATGGLVVPTPSVTVLIKQGTATGSATIPLALGAGALDRTDLVKVGLPAAPKVAKTDVTLTVTGTDLKIDLKNLGGAALGLYKGLVFVTATNASVLEVQLRVVP